MAKEKDQPKEPELAEEPAAKPVSLKPLKVEEALAGLMQVDPPESIRRAIKK